MLSLDHYRARRSQLLAALKRPALLLAGGEIARNTLANPYPYRADSNFLLFFAPPEPRSAALFDPDAGRVTLFLPERTLDGSVWMGEVPPFDLMREKTGVDAVFAVERITEKVRELAKKRKVDSIAVADAEATRLARDITGRDLVFGDPERHGPERLVDALVPLRLCKTDEEIAEVKRAAAITRRAFVGAFQRTRPGLLEQELAGHVEGTYARHGAVPGYETILSVRGEILHNHSHDQNLHEGDLVLMDSGAEVDTGWGADVTRTWPVTGRFSPEARPLYDTVLRAKNEGVRRCRAGTRYRDVHLDASRCVAEGLSDAGLLRGPIDDLIDTGAHALFFPHGVGHLLGLDTHDLRIFGERIAYPDGRRRSESFGTAFLRMDRDLEAGMIVTIEPGLYFVPAILRNPDFRKRFAEHVDFERAETYVAMNEGRGFGGIRIEDDVLVTDGDPENLTASIPQEPDDLESVVGRSV